MKQSKLPIIVAIAAILTIGIAIATYFITKDTNGQEAANYQACVDQGNEVLTTDPPQCVDNAGVTHVKNVENDDSEAQYDVASDDEDTREAPDITNPDEKTFDIVVYFSKRPESNNDLDYTRAAARSSNRTDIGSYALEQLMTGPTEDESSDGLYSPLKGVFTGESNCEGGNLRLSVSNRVATLKFCRDVETSGVGDDARIEAVINKTLQQFSTVDEVKILTRDSDCFGDISGQNKCLDD